MGRLKIGKGQLTLRAVLLAFTVFCFAPVLLVVIVSRASHVLAFRPDVTDMEDKLAVIKSIVTEYAGLLCCGCVDPDVYLPMFLEKLEEAGIDEVIGEYQAQYDEWRDAK